MNAEEKQVQQEIILSIGPGLLPEASYTIFREKLVAYIHVLIDQDFEKLVRILYRLDVNEKKLKALLVKANADSGLLIADLIIERQLEKIHTRKQFAGSKEDIPDEEKW